MYIGEKKEKYIIYGSNRVAKDFLYIFNNLNIVAYLNDDVETEHIRKTIVTHDSAQIIVCDFEHTLKENTLIQLGLKRGTDYLLEEDFFESLDNIHVPQDKECYIWGTGKMAGYFLGEGPKLHIDGFIDSNESIENFEGYKVFRPDYLKERKNSFVIVAVAKNREIVKFMHELGKKDNIDFCIYDKLIGQPSRMLRKTIFDRSRYEIECHTMLNHLEILAEGNTRCCCTTFVDQSLGNITQESFDDIWLSNLHRIMCLSLENRTYSFCNKEMCPLFVGCSKRDAISCFDEYQHYQIMEQFPKVLVAGFDASCNLRCETCRKNFYYSCGEDKQVQSEILDIIKNEYICSVNFLILAGDGEVFASNTYKQLFTMPECQPRYIRLLTNGTLFNEKNWKRLTENKDSKIMMTVSIDAATKETYEKIRRGGDFSKLKSNMEYAAMLRKSGQLSYLRFNFVVQRENYKEIPAFILWGESLGVDEIFFTKILNWGTYSDKEFETVSMMEKDGITPKVELAEILESDILKNSKIVDLGTIRSGHRIDYKEAVYNYYMWELEKRGGNLFSKL